MCRSHIVKVHVASLFQSQSESS
ncbi:GNAT family N-acetyltransferase, partial [Lacticaseibacillus paracasei]